MPTDAKKVFLLILGGLFLLLGVIGIFVPLLPTTPFVLLAAWCFMKSSERFHNWLLRHPHFGPMIEDWRRTRRIPVKARIWASIMLLLSFLLIYFYTT